MPSTLGWSLLSISTTIRCILCAFIIYYGCKFHKFRNYQPLQKRYPTFMYFGSILMLIYIGLARTFLDLSAIYYYTVNETGTLNQENDWKFGYTFLFLGLVFYAVSIHGTIIVMAARAWVIYFNTKFAEQVQKQKWSVYIDPINTSISSLWFIQHKKNFGSYRIIGIVIISYYFIEGIIVSLILSATDTPQRSGLFSENVFHATDSILLVIEVIVLVVIWFKIPDFYDIFGLKNELRYVLYSGTVALLIYIAWIPIDMAFGFHIWVYFLSDIALSIFAALTTIILNGYIFLSKDRHLLSTTQKGNINKNQFKLPETLKHDQLINEFLKHLSHEFSIELLLSFIEFSQFKSLMENDEEFMNRIPDGEQKERILCEQLPKSYIVFEKHKSISDHVEKYKLIANDLFDKYINHSAEFEINISYGERNQVTAYINDLKSNQERNRYELYTLFDGCSNTVYTLMSQSHQRFVQSAHYNIHN